MGENRELPPLRIRPRPSRILAIFLLATHGVALSVAGVLPLDWYWRIGLAILVFTSLGNVIGTRVLFLIPWAGREAIWEPDGTWTLTLVSGQQIEVRLLPSTFVTPGLSVLNPRCGRWRSRAMVLLPDSLDPDLLRRLRVRLRL